MPPNALSPDEAAQPLAHAVVRFRCECVHERGTCRCGPSGGGPGFEGVDGHVPVADNGAAQACFHYVPSFAGVVGESGDDGVKGAVLAEPLPAGAFIAGPGSELLEGEGLPCEVQDPREAVLVGVLHDREPVPVQRAGLESAPVGRIGVHVEGTGCPLGVVELRVVVRREPCIGEVRPFGPLADPGAAGGKILTEPDGPFDSRAVFSVTVLA